MDRRWLIAWLVTFVGSLSIFFAAYLIYKATGPHPQMTLFLRQIRHEVRWLIPGLKKKPNARPEDVRIEPHRRHATAAPHARIGQTAQRDSASPGRRGAVQPASRRSRYAVQSGSPITLQ
jgi:hypothetical protein